MKLYVEGDPKGKKTKNGEEYYDEFITLFWQKPGILLHIYRFDFYTI
jgi:hypothetical protein